LPGKNAFCASRSMTEESLPIEYSITGFENRGRFAKDVDALGLERFELAQALLRR
jgi:hypothetical protein